MILTCKQLVEKAGDAREGRLSLVDRAGRAAHLAWCHHCRRFLRQLDETIATARQVSASPVPAALRRSILDQLRRR